MNVKWKLLVLYGFIPCETARSGQPIRAEIMISGDILHLQINAICWAALLETLLSISRTNSELFLDHLPCRCSSYDFFFFPAKARLGN